LLLGPILEEKYHDRLITVILTTALVTGIIHNIIQPHVMLLGASGVVFSFILLASITGKEKGIPITLILVALLWLGQEIYNGIISADNVSQITHIIGGISGAVLGMMFKKR
ncbi:MAG: rhomboid family intramembrane serine protease, partial [Erysipelotrichaceae bacterium]|nr:rhomboid family intramembrane serine protease [Erysipelotrichaceae bacterium]